MRDRSQRTTVLILVGVRLYREGLADALARDPRLDLVGAAADAGNALELTFKLRPDVVLVDLQLPDAAPFVRACTTGPPNAAVLALTRSDSEEELLAVAQAGITGYVTHDTSLTELAVALESAARGEMICSPRAAATLLRQLGALTRHAHAGEGGGLTPRELQIVQLIDAGRSNKEIARELYIEIPTVKNHVHNILEKLGVRRRGEAAAKLRRRGTLGGAVSAPKL